MDTDDITLELSFQTKLKPERSLNVNDANLKDFFVKKTLSGFGFLKQQTQSKTQNTTAVCHVSCISHERKNVSFFFLFKSQTVIIFP